MKRKTLVTNFMTAITLVVTLVIFTTFATFATFASFASQGFAATKTRKVSAQYAAFAPNAGGQVTYGLRASWNNREIGLFQNHYLTAGGQPLLGGVYSFRFPVCDDSCMVHTHVQAGIGGSSAGPLAEFLWGAEIPLLPLALNGGTIPYVPMLRMDFASHWLATRSRIIMWSYPFWVGVTLPF
jgi:hypothetical protein